MERRAAWANDSIFSNRTSHQVKTLVWILVVLGNPQQISEQTADWIKAGFSVINELEEENP